MPTFPRFFSFGKRREGEIVGTEETGTEYNKSCFGPPLLEFFSRNALTVPRGAEKRNTFSKCKTVVWRNQCFPTKHFFAGRNFSNVSPSNRSIVCMALLGYKTISRPHPFRLRDQSGAFFLTELRSTDQIDSTQASFFGIDGVSSLKLSFIQHSTSQVPFFLCTDVRNRAF